MDAIKQWDEGDPGKGLTIPLGMWTPAMIHHNVTYYHRKLIVKEFEHYGRNEDRMREVFGNSMESVGSIIHAIRRRHFVPPLPTEHHPHCQQEQTIPAISNWREAIQPWVNGDPSRGLTVPLCNGIPICDNGQKIRLSTIVAS